MQYRNDSGGPLTVMTDPPLQVWPGQTVESDQHIAGLTPLGGGGEDADAAALDQVGVDATRDPAGQPTADDPAGADASADTTPEPEATP